MSVLEQFRPFVSFCQACGFIPYTMEYDPANKKFVRFTFSIKNFTTWWFLLLTILQISVYFLTSHLTSKMTTEIQNDNDLPSTTPTVSVVFIMVNYLHCFISRWIVLFRYRQLGNFLRALKEIESLLPVRDSPKLANFFRKHFTIGFIIIIVLVIQNLVQLCYYVRLNSYRVIQSLIGYLILWKKCSSLLVLLGHDYMHFIDSDAAILSKYRNFTVN